MNKHYFEETFFITNRNKISEVKFCIKWNLLKNVTVFTFILLMTLE